MNVVVEKIVQLFYFWHFSRKIDLKFVVGWRYEKLRGGGLKGGGVVNGEQGIFGEIPKKF